MIDEQRKKKLYILMLLNILTNQTETEENDMFNLSTEFVVILYMMIVFITLSKRRLSTREDRDPNDVVTHHMLRHHNIHRLFTDPSSSKLPVRRKRSKNIELEQISATFNKFIDMMEQRQLKANTHEVQVAQVEFMEQIGSALVNEDARVDNKKQKVIDEIMALPNFTVKEKLRAGRLIIGDSSNLDMFRLLPNNMKAEFIQEVLHP